MITRENSCYSPKNEDEARLIQELCFAVGIRWASSGTKVQCQNEKRYVIDDGYLAFNAIDGYVERSLKEFIDLILSREIGVVIEVNGEKITISKESARALYQAIGKQL